MQESVLNALRSLHARRFGGPDVAERPDHRPETTFAGRSVAGADVFASWFANAVQSDVAESLVLVLLGAPGNGKSFVAAQLLGEVSQQASDSRKLEARHKRKYETELPSGRHLTIVNDASIRSGNEADEGARGRPSLALDITEALDAQSHLLLNVNRGVVFEEIGELRGDSGLAAGIIHWIFDESVRAFGVAIDVRVEDSDSRSSRSLDLVSKVSGQSVCRVWVVDMDAHSLFESRVDMSWDGSLSPPDQNGRYQICGMQERTVDHYCSTPAGEVMQKLFRAIGASGSTEGEVDALVANAQNLASPTLQAGVCSILRSAEIVGGQRFSYRELWGAMSVLQFGEPSALSVEDVEFLGEHTFSRLTEASALSDVIRVARLRLHQALFSASGSLDSNHELDLSSSWAMKNIRKVDPVTDARVSAESALGWAAPVYEAFYGISDQSSILENLLEDLPSEDRAHEYVTPFDRLVDRRVCETLSGGLSASERNRCLRWYARYLLRLYAVANGIPAFNEEIREWIASWNLARIGYTLGDQLRDGLYALVLPELINQGGKRHRLLPLFDSRVGVITDLDSEVRIAIEIPDDITEVAEVDNDRLFVSFSVSGATRLNEVKLSQLPVRMEVDFSLLREALASSAGRIGHTELASVAVPRIERFRSSLIASASRIGAPRHFAVSSDIFERIFVDTAVVQR